MRAAISHVEPGGGGLDPFVRKALEELRQAGSKTQETRQHHGPAKGRQLEDANDDH